MAHNTELPERPYLSSKEIDALARVNTELLSELWILRDRVLVLEHLLSEAGVIAEDAVDTFEPSEEFSAKLMSDRDDVVARVVGAAHRRELTVDEIKKNS